MPLLKVSLITLVCRPIAVGGHNRSDASHRLCFGCRARDSLSSPAELLALLWFSPEGLGSSAGAGSLKKMVPVLTGLTEAAVVGFPLPVVTRDGWLGMKTSAREMTGPGGSAQAARRGLGKTELATEVNHRSG